MEVLYINLSILVSFLYFGRRARNYYKIFEPLLSCIPSVSVTAEFYVASVKCLFLTNARFYCSNDNNGKPSPDPLACKTVQQDLLKESEKGIPRLSCVEILTVPPPGLFRPVDILQLFLQG